MLTQSVGIGRQEIEFTGRQQKIPAQRVDTGKQQKLLTQRVDTGRYRIQPISATRRDIQTKAWLLCEFCHVSVICRHNTEACCHSTGVMN